MQAQVEGSEVLGMPLLKNLLNIIIWKKGSWSSAVTQANCSRAINSTRQKILCTSIGKAGIPKKGGEVIIYWDMPACFIY